MQMSMSETNTPAAASPETPVSMTGFGNGLAEQGEQRISVELRSVNQRFLEAKFRLPNGYQALEPELKERVQRVCRRGKLDITIKLEEQESAGSGRTLNTAVATQYGALLDEFEQASGRKVAVSARDLLALPGLIVEGAPETEDEWIPAGITAALDEALAGLQQMRIREGQALVTDILARLDACENQLVQVEQDALKLPAHFQQKLRDNLAQLAQGVEVSEERVHQEIAVMAERLDVSEEFVRFRTHLDHMRGMLQTPGSGRKLDFLTQELNREINTIASKCGHAGISHAAVEVKGELERIREQIQNLE